MNEAVIGMRGRTVRCTACKTTWHAEVPIDLRYSEGRRPEDDEPEDATPTKPEQLKSVKAGILPAKYRAMLSAQAKIRAVAIEGLVWGGLAALAVLAVSLAYVLRVDIVRAFPRIAGAYAMVGLKTNGTNLQFGDQKATTSLKGGRFVVTVEAQVKNVSDDPAPVPPVRVKMLDATQAQFNSLLMPPGGLVVAPHATRTLTFDVPDPKNQVAGLDLTFDLEAMKAMKSAKPHAAGSTTKPHEAAAGSEAASPQEGHPAPVQAPAPAAHGPDDHAEAEGALDSDAGAANAPVSNREVPPLRSTLSADGHHGTGEG
ncbi:MJ0042-type zinc finger domain-containing protein [Asticcacaulis solisilvae]|uniref:MJ0042-type zinc finger domain-containing protein n=1 Tax=Asticcacaulis solisilvae TaxID=1217274 RepID=UPI003FD6EC03